MWPSEMCLWHRFELWQLWQFCGKISEVYLVCVHYTVGAGKVSKVLEFGIAKAVQTL